MINNNYNVHLPRPYNFQYDDDKTKALRRSPPLIVVSDDITEDIEPSKAQMHAPSSVSLQRYIKSPIADVLLKINAKLGGHDRATIEHNDLTSHPMEIITSSLVQVPLDYFYGDDCYELPLPLAHIEDEIRGEL